MGHLQWLLLLFGILLVTAGYLYFEVNTLRVTRYTVYIKELPVNFNGYTLLHLSDLHNKEFGQGQKKLLGLLHTQSHDLVAITGDLAAKHRSGIGPITRLLAQLKGKPVYFVPGNHDRETGFQIESALRENSVGTLLNSAVKLRRGGQHIWLAGVDDPHLGRDNLKQALAVIDDAAPKILLAHAPGIFPEAIEETIDLLLVGHTHGGQVRLPFLGALFVPGQGLFPEWDYGVFRRGETIMVVNAGLGESGLPLRFLNRPEIVLVTLKAPGN